jgi:hypothetical protein
MIVLNKWFEFLSENDAVTAETRRIVFVLYASNYIMCIICNIEDIIVLRTGI